MNGKEDFFQWMSRCCSMPLSTHKSEHCGTLTVIPGMQKPKKGRRARKDVNLDVKARKYDEISMDDLQYFPRSEASAGVGIVFQSTRSG